MEEKLLSAFILLLFVLFVLDIIGPDAKKDEPVFWKIIHLYRKTLDLIAYWIFNIAAIFTAGAMVVYCVYTLIKRGAGGIGTVAVLAALSIMVFLATRSMIRSRKRGELCDCTGKCDSCRIKCRSNPKYYGVLKNNSGDRKAE